DTVPASSTGGAAETGTDHVHSAERERERETPAERGGEVVSPSLGMAFAHNPFGSIGTPFGLSPPDIKDGYQSTVVDTDPSKYGFTRVQYSEGEDRQGVAADGECDVAYVEAPPSIPEEEREREGE
ncbi:hypothetical protein KIPB_014896, partial [Kipferlia bialata]